MTHCTYALNCYVACIFFEKHVTSVPLYPDCTCYLSTLTTHRMLHCTYTDKCYILPTSLQQTLEGSSHHHEAIPAESDWQEWMLESASFSSLASHTSSLLQLGHIVQTTNCSLTSD